MTIKQILQTFFQSLRRFFRQFQRTRNPNARLQRTCDRLEQQLASTQTRSKIWKTYAKVLALAQNCNDLSVAQAPRDQLAQIILKFDSRIPGSDDSLIIPAGKAIAVLLSDHPLTAQALEAAWQIAPRLQQSSRIRAMQQDICVALGRLGESNALLVKLLKREEADLLSQSELSDVLHAYLGKHSFQLTDSWKAFFGQLPAPRIPRIHQVYAMLGRYREAADIASEVGDARCEVEYLLNLPNRDIAQQVLDLAERVGDATLLRQAHQNVAEFYWQDQEDLKALQHFQCADNLERVSDCHQRLGVLGQAIEVRPQLQADWVQTLCQDLEYRVRAHIEQEEYLDAVRLLKSVKDAWDAKAQMTEAERTQLLLTEAVRTARSYFKSELEHAQTSRPPTDLFKRWSRIEEAAGHYQEAAVQAEKARDYFSASLLYEKADAFGQALVALESASSEPIAPQRKAQLLEQGGDFFQAGLLFEQLGQIDTAIAMYKKSGEFQRAAHLRRQQLDEETVLFDEQYKGLLADAGCIEQLAELCIAKAAEPEYPAEQKAKLFRRVKALSVEGLLGQQWLDQVNLVLPDLEAIQQQDFEAKAGGWVAQARREVLDEYADVVGLDLGTSNSVVCLYHKIKREAEVVEVSGRRQIPSIFAIDQQGREQVGVPLSKLLSRSPRAIITKAKREMGTQRKFRAAGQDYRAEEISARIINHARQLACDYLQQKIGDRLAILVAQTTGSKPPQDWINAYFDKHPLRLSLKQGVVTVPAYFNEAQKQATKTAGVLSDVRILRLIHEPTAACLAQRLRKHQEETILVADLGAGTFDLSIILAEEGVYEVLEIEGDNALGSADLDHLLYQHFEAKIKAETGETFSPNSQAATRLRQGCEVLKIELSSQSEWTIDLPYLVGHHTIQLALTRPELERIAQPWLEKIQAICRKIKQKPNRILLVGGGGLMPAVQQCIQEIFQLKPESGLDSLTAVARGAAIQAAILIGETLENVLVDVTPFSLGIKCYVQADECEFSSIIPKHTKIPTLKTKRCTTVEDSQTNVRIEIFQGESSSPEDNFKIGEFILSDLPSLKAGVPQIDVQFDIDPNCLLVVTARDAVTGNQQSITIADSHLLTPAQTDFLQAKFRKSQAYQDTLANLDRFKSELSATLDLVETIDLLNLSRRFQDRLRTYEQYRDRYAPSSVTDQTLFEIYRDRTALADKTRLLLDQWGALSRSICVWIDQYGGINWHSDDVETQIQHLLDNGSLILQRTQIAEMEVSEISTHYQRWLSVLDNLPINPEGDAEELAQHFLRLQKYTEAQQQFERIQAPLSLEQIDLGLEILASQRQHDAYIAMLKAHTESLGIQSPNFKDRTQTAQNFLKSVVRIQIQRAGRVVYGNGVVVSDRHIATNRHLLMQDETNVSISPQSVSILTTSTTLKVNAIHSPQWGADDVALLELEPTLESLCPVRLGFSELIEVGERVMTLGFMRANQDQEPQTLLCQTGLVNRIRPSQLCTERVLEVSIPLTGTTNLVNGAPVLNQWGEVVGLLTLATDHRPASSKTSMQESQSFYALPVKLLRRLSQECLGSM